MSFVLERDTAGVRVLTLDRPETLNALTLEGMRELGERVEAAAADPAVRALVLTGSGKAFSAGGDAQFLLGIPAMTDAELRTVVYGTFQRPVRAIRAMPKPVVAAVNGPAVGAGCELAVDAAEAHRIGLVTRVVPAGELLDAAMALARALAQGPAKALAAAKAAINRGLASDFWSELDATVADQLGCFRTADFAEGVRALAERRPPMFGGE